MKNAETRDRTGDLQIFSLTLSQLSYRGVQSNLAATICRVCGASSQKKKNGAQWSRECGGDAGKPL